MKRVKAGLMKINLAMKGDQWEKMDLRVQTERECGIRTVTYMLKFKEWATRQLNSEEIVRRINEVVENEKTDPGNLADKYRSVLNLLLRNEQRKIGGTV